MTDMLTADDGNAGFSEAWNELREREQGQSAEERSDGQHSPGAEGGSEGDASRPTPDDEAADAGRPTAAQEITDDFWANADPRAKAAFEEATARAARAENSVRSHEGRLLATQRESEKLRTRLSQIEARLPAPEPEADPKAEEEAIARLREEYPDVAAPILSKIDKLGQAVADLSERSASQEEQQEAQHKLELQQYLADEEQKLATAHPDWNAVVLSQPFVEWFGRQPRAVKDAVRRNGEGIVDAEEAGFVIDLFKSTQKPTPEAQQHQQRRERQMDGSLAVPSRTGTAPAQAPADDFESEWKRLAERDRRKANRR